MLVQVTIEIPGATDRGLKTTIKRAIRPLLDYNRRWVLIKSDTDTPPDPKPWDWDWSEYEKKYGCDMLVSDLERMLGYSSLKNYNSYLMEGSTYVWKYRKTRLSTILKHLKTDIRSMKIVIEE